MKAHFEAHFKRVAEMKAAAKAAQENPNLTVSEMEPQNSSTCRDEKEERSKDLNEIQEEVPGESLEERLPEDDEANEQEGSEKKEKVFEGFNGDDKLLLLLMNIFFCSDILSPFELNYLKFCFCDVLLLIRTY